MHTSTLTVEIRSPSPAPPQDQPSDSSSLTSLPSVESQSVLDFIASDSTLDRYGEIVSPSGWRLDSYLRNPVFQNAHQYGDIIFTLGRALITEIRQSQSPSSNLPSPCLYQRIQFAVDTNPIAKIAYGLYRGQFLRAVSVGFIPIKWQDAPSRSSSCSIPSSSPVVSSQSSCSLSSPRSTLHLSPRPCRRKYLEQELLEVSAVSIPANPNALALAIKSGAIEKSDLQETADLINYTLSAAGPTGQPANLGSLLQLARAIYTHLRHL